MSIKVIEGADTFRLCDDIPLPEKQEEWRSYAAFIYRSTLRMTPSGASCRFNKNFFTGKFLSPWDCLEIRRAVDEWVKSDEGRKRLREEREEREERNKKEKEVLLALWERAIRERDRPYEVTRQYKALGEPAKVYGGLWKAFGGMIVAQMDSGKTAAETARYIRDCCPDLGENGGFYPAPNNVRFIYEREISVRPSLEAIGDGRKKQKEMVEKKRRARIIEIWDRRRGGQTYREIAEIFDISPDRARQIYIGTEWRMKKLKLWSRKVEAKPIEIDAASDRDVWHEFRPGDPL